MKKNILTIIVMAVSIVNLVLGIVLVFSIVPALNIDDPNSEEQDYTIDDLVAYTKTYDSAVNINLKKDAGDDSNHYAQLAGFTISFNSKADDYKKVSESIQTNDIYVDDIVKETLGSYTATTLDLVKVRSEIVKKIQEKYNTKAVVEISLKDPLIA